MIDIDEIEFPPLPEMLRIVDVEIAHAVLDRLEGYYGDVGMELEVRVVWAWRSSISSPPSPPISQYSACYPSLERAPGRQ